MLKAQLQEHFEEKWKQQVVVVWPNKLFSKLCVTSSETKMSNTSSS